MKQTISQKIPDSFQGILWSKNIRNFDLEKDRIYIIHQVLSYGNFRQIKWLFKIYNKSTIKNVFINYPRPIYSPQNFKFIKEIILNFKDIKLKKEKYVKNILGGSIRGPKKGV